MIGRCLDKLKAITWWTAIIQTTKDINGKAGLFKRSDLNFKGENDYAN